MWIRYGYNLTLGGRVKGEGEEERERQVQTLTNNADVGEGLSVTLDDTSLLQVQRDHPTQDHLEKVGRCQVMDVPL